MVFGSWDFIWQSVSYLKKILLMNKNHFTIRWLKISSWGLWISSIKYGDINFWLQFGAVLFNSTIWAIQKEIAVKLRMLYSAFFRLLLLFYGFAESISIVENNIMTISTHSIFIFMKIFNIKKSLNIFYLQIIIELGIQL